MSRSPKNVSTNSGPDVSQLEKESISTSDFPVARLSPFRVHFDPQAYGGMTAHASEDVSFEICGVLVGDWGRDADGPFVTVRHFIRCDSAAKKFAEVTFTHESWSHINREMDTKYQDQRIVGWYHSHPNFGIFLSDRDLFIQQNFFSGPGQVALVIDPVRKIAGVFEWQRGNAVPTPHFWVGSRVFLAPEGSHVTGMPEGPLNSVIAAEELPQSVRGSWGQEFSNASTIVLTGMAMFLMGWIVSGWLASGQRRADVVSTVERMMWGIMRPELNEEFHSTELGLIALRDRLNSLAKDHLELASKSENAKDDPKVIEQTRNDWKSAMEATNNVYSLVRQTRMRCDYTKEEQEAVILFIEKLKRAAERAQREDAANKKARNAKPTPQEDMNSKDDATTNESEKLKQNSSKPQSQKP